MTICSGRKVDQPLNCECCLWAQLCPTHIAPCSSHKNNKMLELLHFKKKLSVIMERTKHIFPIEIRTWRGWFPIPGTSHSAANHPSGYCKVLARGKHVIHKRQNLLIPKPNLLHNWLHPEVLSIVDMNRTCDYRQPCWSPTSTGWRCD